MEFVLPSPLEKELILDTNKILNQCPAPGIQRNGSGPWWHGCTSADRKSPCAHLHVAVCDHNLMIVRSVQEPVERHIGLPHKIVGRMRVRIPVGEPGSHL